jgi:cytochrome c biogenesis protein CcmG, thiol:disulfide interchange protein DsbE
VGPRRLPIAIAGLAALMAVLAAGCGSQGPDSAAVSVQDYERALSGAPPPLRRLYSEPGVLLDGGKTAFERRIAELRGHPVVVNKWASWCGPCRFEFPFFQRQVKKRGTRVAFLAVDGLDAKDDAAKFLEKYPVPYPSYFDPDGDIAKQLGGRQGFPTTAFFDPRGDLVYLKQGGYASEAALADDIAQYALGRG